VICTSKIKSKKNKTNVEVVGASARSSGASHQFPVHMEKKSISQSGFFGQRALKGSVAQRVNLRQSRHRSAIQRRHRFR
jgi:hypothetical protein